MKLKNPVDLFEKVLSIASPKKARLLGIDVGSKFVGLALSNSSNTIASPLSVLVRTKWNIDLMATDFQTLIKKYSVAGFVVGFPYSLPGQSSVEAIQVKLFINDLSKTGRLEDMSFTYWDENFSSKCVEAMLEPLNLHPAESKTIVDKFAAVGILQEYLDGMNLKLTSSTGNRVRKSGIC